jgi:hypothetical protein
MKRRPWLLALAAGLFAAWIFYLATLALTTSHPTVLSRPQFLVADLWVIADVDDLDKPVTVVEAPFAVKGDAPEKGTKIELGNLSMSKDVWKGPGHYLVPLSRAGDRYYVTPVPRSPGYPPEKMTLPPVRIYPDTPETRAQLDHLPRPKPPEAS